MVSPISYQRNDNLRKNHFSLRPPIQLKQQFIIRNCLSIINNPLKLIVLIYNYCNIVIVIPFQLIMMKKAVAALLLLVSSLALASNPFKYGGYLDGDSDYGVKIFYWFFPAQNPDAPLILWLQGIVFFCFLM
jgi:hypothetical protein